jgi:hypothetical protein
MLVQEYHKVKIKPLTSGNSELIDSHSTEELKDTPLKFELLYLMHFPERIYTFRRELETFLFSLSFRFLWILLTLEILMLKFERNDNCPA